MPTEQKTVTIERPIDEVFAYVADGRNNVHWRPRVIEIEPTSSTQGEGATYHQVVKGIRDVPTRSDYRVTACSPPRELAFEVTTGPARPKGRYRLEEAGPARTTLTFSLDLKPTGPMRLASSMIAKMMRSEVEQLDRLKAELER